MERIELSTLCPAVKRNNGSVPILCEMRDARCGLIGRPARAVPALSTGENLRGPGIDWRELAELAELAELKLGFMLVGVLVGAERLASHCAP